MMFLTKRRKARLVEELTAQAVLGAYMSYEVRGDDSRETQYNQMLFHVESAFYVIEREPRWWQRKPKTKTCTPVPCPPFEDYEFVQEAAHDGGPGFEPCKGN